jgi:excisionase family DNA binding protein
MPNIPHSLPKYGTSNSLHNLPEPEWMTVAEAAHYLSVQPRTILLWVRQGQLPGYALSGLKRRVWRFRKADLDAALLRGSTSMLSSASPSVLAQKGEQE